MITKAMAAAVVAGVAMIALPAKAGEPLVNQPDSTGVANAAAKRGETAADESSARTKRHTLYKPEPAPFKDRWAFSTNAFNWLLMLPNVRMEFTLTNPAYKPAYTLSLQAQWNGSTSVSRTRMFQYRLNDYRVEVRRYSRVSTVLPVAKDGEAENIKKKQRTPKFWRAYYVGLYGGYTEYSLIWKTGFAGSLYSAGVTGGWQIPLYAGKNGSGIDLDLGLSLGAVVLKQDKYRYQYGWTERDESYTKYRNYKLVPYPVLTEVRVGFVYRFNSVRNQFKKKLFKGE